jgi:hypothetical protein
MRGGNGLLLVVVGLFALYLAVTGRLDCFAAFFQCATTGKASSPSPSPFGSGMPGPNILNPFPGSKL